MSPDCLNTDLILSSASGLFQLPLLIAAAVLGGLELNSSAPFCHANQHSLGGFLHKHDAVVLCQENLATSTTPLLSVVKHELVHVVQDRLGRGGVGLLPDPLLTPLVRQLLPDREVMAVLMLYPTDQVNGELEARLASRYLPSELIAIGLVSTRVLGLNQADAAHPMQSKTALHGDGI